MDGTDQPRIDANERNGPQMDANERELLNELIGKVIGAIYEVANTLGPGFLEKVYERALLIELRLRGLAAEAQMPASVIFNTRKLSGDVLFAIFSPEQGPISPQGILKPIRQMRHISYSRSFAFICGTFHSHSFAANTRLLH